MTPSRLARAAEAVSGLPRGGGVAKDLERLLKTTHQRASQNNLNGQGTPDGLTSAEASVLGSVNNSLATADQKAGKRIRSRVNAVLSTAHESLRRCTELERLVDHPRWTSHRVVQPVPAVPQQIEVQHEQETFDHNQGLFSARSLVLLELVFLVVEFFFWYTMFTYTVDRRAGWADPQRLSAILLALLIPLAGVAAARLAGGLAHRWYKAYQGTDRRRALGAALAALAVFTILLLAVARLVYVRFAEDSVAIGAPVIPAVAMAALFVGVLLIDMTSRTFMISEVREQYQRRSAEFAKLKNKVIKANQAHAKAWWELHAAVQMHYDQAARIETVGKRILADSEARWGDLTTRYPLPEVPQALQAAPNGSQGGVMRLPNPQALGMLTSNGALAPARTIEGATEVLAAFPPWDSQSLKSQIKKLWSELHCKRERDDRQDLDQSVPPDQKAS